MSLLDRSCHLPVYFPSYLNVKPHSVYEQVEGQYRCGGRSTEGASSFTVA